MTGPLPQGMQDSIPWMLFASNRSPFVRKVLIAACELQLLHRLQLVDTSTGSTRLNHALMQWNPLNRIPTLVCADGSCIHDSGVICEYLDACSDAMSLIPHAGPQRIECLQLHAIGNGIMELNVQRLVEAGREPHLRSSQHEQAYRHKTLATVQSLESQVTRLQAPTLHLGHISVACALAHLDFRFTDDGWRTQAPQLAHWLDRFSQRRSMQLTRFGQPYFHKD